jgi:YD repeat-containing protein
MATTRIDRVDRPNSPWRARYTADGRRLSRTFRTKADAER